MDRKMSAQIFDEKYALYKTTLFRIAYTYLKNSEDCEDILQEVFIRLLTHSEEFESLEYEKHWLIRVTVNLCKNQLRSFWNRKRASLEEVSEFTEDSYDFEIMQLILNLPEKYKAVIYLYYMEDYKCREIAEILQLKESAVKMRLQKGRQLLKIQLTENML